MKFRMIIYIFFSNWFLYSSCIQQPITLSSILVNIGRWFSIYTLYCSEWTDDEESKHKGCCGRSGHPLVALFILHFPSESSRYISRHKTQKSVEIHILPCEERPSGGFRFDILGLFRTTLKKRSSYSLKCLSPFLSYLFWMAFGKTTSNVFLAVRITLHPIVHCTVIKTHSVTHSYYLIAHIIGDHLYTSITASFLAS